ncbi:hypothetical protein C8Q73DRAFT_54592 [Cubamyces lactineus]|nr:hypothetical protein C8Q73DRAFT_54592 [Cubamyces lactineus]
MSLNTDGVYYIQHAHIPARIALASHSSNDGTPVISWTIKDEFLDHMWVIKSVPNEADTYTIRNTVGGTFMDSGGQTAKGAQIVGYHQTSSDNQKWIIKKETSGTGYWKIQNKATKNFVDLLYGGIANGTKIVGWNGSWNDSTSLGHQHWTFSPQSLRGSEIHTILKNSPHLRQDFKSYQADGTYLILSHARLHEIWKRSELSSRKWRSEIFDSDHFAFAYKTEAAKWGDDSFKSDGFAIMCGVMFGVNPTTHASRAYNWVVNPEDHSTIIYFDPQDNTFIVRKFSQMRYSKLAMLSTSV